MLFLLLSIVLADEPIPTPIPITAELKPGSKVQEVTNTLLYSIELTNFTTVFIRENGLPELTVTSSSHIVYIPTILRYLKVIDDVPTRTVTITPVATQKLKSAILKPGILVGVTFAILFLVGVIYTSLCRKPQAARRPKPVNKSANNDAFNRAKSKRARSSGGNRHQTTTRSTRSGSAGGTSRGGSSRGGASRGGTSRGGNRGGTRGTRGRTSNRV